MLAVRAVVSAVEGVGRAPGRQGGHVSGWSWFPRSQQDEQGGGGRGGTTWRGRIPGLPLIVGRCSPAWEQLWAGGAACLGHYHRGAGGDPQSEARRLAAALPRSESIGRGRAEQTAYAAARRQASVDVATVGWPRRRHQQRAAKVGSGSLLVPVAISSVQEGSGQTDMQGKRERKWKHIREMSEDQVSGEAAGHCRDGFPAGRRRTEKRTQTQAAL